MNFVVIRHWNASIWRLPGTCAALVDNVSRTEKYGGSSTGLQPGIVFQVFTRLPEGVAGDCGSL
jgi:hypothetical protein